MVKSLTDYSDLNSDSYDVLELLNSLSTAVVLARPSGNLVVANEAAQKMLSIYGIQQKGLREIIKTIDRSKNIIISDQPINNRIIRFYGQYLDLPGKKPLVVVSLLDATDDWTSARRQDILEYTAGTFTQSIHNPEWIKSVLNRIVVMMDVKSADVMLYEPKANLLRDLTDFDKQIKIGEGTTGRAAKLRVPVVTYNTPAHNKHTKHEQAHSLLAVPMIVGNKLVGVLNIRDKANQYFREKDKVFYSILANRFALAIEHRALLSQLKQEYERLVTVINNTQHGMALLGGNRSIITANAALAGILGQDIADLTGKKIETIMPELKIAFRGNAKQMTKEVQLASVAGKPWVKVTATRTTPKRSSSIVLTIRDTTAEKMLEQMKNDFIASATHELRTPITAIMGYLSMLANKQNNFDTKQKYYLQRINEASNILFNLVEDLLTVLRLDQEKAAVKPKKQNLLPLIKEVLRGLETKINNKGLRLNLAPTDMVVYADTAALQKVLSNLIDNAIKYSKPNGRISIKIQPAGKGKLAKVLIEDTGVGIPKKEQAKIFEKFHRVPNELSVEAGGTGLGLYISSKLAEQWHGKLRLEASSPRGSTFSFTVPTKKEFALGGKHKKANV